MNNSLDSLLRNAITKDGKMDAGYIPANPLDLTTKKYVDDNAGGSSFIHHGTELPDDSVGKDGDIYFRYPLTDIKWVLHPVISLKTPPPGVEHDYGMGLVQTKGFADQFFGTVDNPPESHGITVATVLWVPGSGGTPQLVVSFDTKHIGGKERIRIMGHTFTDAPISKYPLLIFMIHNPPANIGVAMKAGTPIDVELLETVAASSTDYSEYSRRAGHWMTNNPIMSNGTVEMDTGYIPPHSLSVVTKEYLESSASPASIIHHGRVDPDDSLGDDGDLYYKYTNADTSDIVVRVIPTSDVPLSIAQTMPAGVREVWSLKGDSIGVRGETATLEYPYYFPIGSDPDILLGFATGNGKHYLWILPLQERNPHGRKALTLAEVPNWERIHNISRAVLFEGLPDEVTLTPIYNSDSGAPAAHALGAVVFEIDNLAKIKLVSTLAAAGNRDHMLITLHTNISHERAEGNYDMYMKVAGHWIEHKPLQADGMVSMSRSYTPKEATDVATKGYVDDIVGSIRQVDDLFASMVPTPGLAIATDVFPNSFYINEHGILRFKQADGTLKTVTLTT